MDITNIPEIAIIADAHLHDTHSNYPVPGVYLAEQRLILRSWADTRSASRVFNESRAALDAVLTDIIQRGIRHIVLLGDYTDDGQIESTARLIDRLTHYRHEFGVSFFAIPGNHDVFGPVGKHQSTRFMSSTTTSVAVTSDHREKVSAESDAIVTKKMYREGSPAGLIPMGEFGLFKQEHYLHWESPFGLSDAIADRCYTIHSADGSRTCRHTDASYLVEPVAGLWLLMLDVNVYEPRNGLWEDHQKRAYIDCSDEGWNAVLKHRQYLFVWISSVVKRASKQNKKLLALSHYPAIDPFDDTANREYSLFGENDSIRRKPNNLISKRLLDSGLHLHFGGHLHINALSRRSSGEHVLTDVAIPSPVAYPPAYKSVKCRADGFDIFTQLISDENLDHQLMQFYRNEVSARGEPPDPALSAKNYGQFLYRRIQSRVLHHYLSAEWPPEIAEFVKSHRVIDLVYRLMEARPQEQTDRHDCQINPVQASYPTQLEDLLSNHEVCPDSLNNCSMLQMVSDWYCIRQAGHMAKHHIHLDKLKIYEFLSQEFGKDTKASRDDLVKFMGPFLAILRQALDAIRPLDKLVSTDVVTLHGNKQTI